MLRFCVLTEFVYKYHWGIALDTNKICKCVFNHDGGFSFGGDPGRLTGRCNPMTHFSLEKPAATESGFLFAHS